MVSGIVKKNRPVSRILYHAWRDPYHLSGAAVTHSLYLPTLRLGRTTLKRRFIWHFTA